MANYDPLARARQQAQGGGSRSGRASFFRIDDGESKGLRFMTGTRPAKVVNHACGLRNYEIDLESWDAAKSSGGMVCPKCGQPITDGDVVGDRPSVVMAFAHRFVPTSEPGRRANFVCIGDPDNAANGLVPANPDGSPKYSCPICEMNRKKDGSNRRGVTCRIIGAAVERKIDVNMVPNEMGIPVPTVVGANDVMETDDEGNVKPKMVIVDMGYQSFWGKLDAIADPKTTSLAYYDWSVSRVGSGLETQYQVQLVGALDKPDPVDFEKYARDIPDLEAVFKAQGTPQHYIDNGFPIVGYVPEGAQQAQPQQAPFDPQPAQYAQPQAYEQPYQQSQPAVQGGVNAWDAISSQLGNQ